MREMPARIIKIFYCYAYEDRTLRDELERHLSPLKRLGRITEWYDPDIQAGAEWKHEIGTQLDAADIVLLLVSSDLMYSDYCYSIEMQRALERHKIGFAHGMVVSSTEISGWLPSNHASRENFDSMHTCRLFNKTVKRLTVLLWEEL